MDIKSGSVEKYQIRVPGFQKDRQSINAIVGSIQVNCLIGIVGFNMMHLILRLFKINKYIGPCLILMCVGCFLLMLGHHVAYIDQYGIVHDNPILLLCGACLFLAGCIWVGIIIVSKVVSSCKKSSVAKSYQGDKK